MSGIEILGVVAAAAQFIDLGAKLVIKWSHFASSLRKVPESVSSTLSSLKIFVRHCEDLKTQLAELDEGTLRLSTKDLLLEVFDACMVDINALLSILDEVVFLPNDGKVKKSWKVIVGAKREKGNS